VLEALVVAVGRQGQFLARLASLGKVMPVEQVQISQGRTTAEVEAGPVLLVVILLRDAEDSEEQVLLATLLDLVLHTLAVGEVAAITQVLGARVALGEVARAEVMLAALPAPPTLVGVVDRQGEL
jgi:hypothetical protein